MLWCVLAMCPCCKNSNIRSDGGQKDALERFQLGLQLARKGTDADTNDTDNDTDTDHSFSHLSVHKALTCPEGQRAWGPWVHSQLGEKFASSRNHLGKPVQTSCHLE